MTKIALVTGANTGIGFEAVRGLAEQGFTVYLGSRDAAKGEAAAKELRDAGDVRFVRIDMLEESSFKPVLDTIEREHGQLDVLVNNAGIAMSGTALDCDRETIDISFQTNLHGPVRLTQLALPLLRKAPAARVVNVSSGAGQFAFMSGKYESPMAPDYPPPFAYCMSKTALNAATVMLARELGKEGMKVNACNPGFVKSQVSRFMGTKSPADGARIIVKMATLPDDGPNGGFFDDRGSIEW